MVPGLCRVGPQGLSMGSGAHGTAFPWTKMAVPTFPTPGAEGRNNHCEGSLSPASWGLDVIALEMMSWW